MSIKDNYIIKEIFDIFNATDINKIKSELSQNKDSDPFVYFYEDFLRAYDTKMSKDKGVYYTPKPVVNFMIKQSEYFLKKHFGKKGLHDKKVTTLDFATGTGTFMQSIIECILHNKQAGDIQDLIHDHILKNVYAFELMPAPYTVAHMKLSEFLINKGYTFQQDERMQIYMTNTLSKSKTQGSLFFDELDNEVNKAQEIKDKNILFICGNPPYNNQTQNKNSNTSKKNTVEEKPFDKILKLLEDYKNGLTGKNDKYALNNDYIKFIRFAHDKVMNSGEGMISIITPNSFLEKISFRVMRQKLVNDFDEIYIINLHGESGVRGDKTSKDDQNVFDIQEGVCITYFIKLKNNPAQNTLVKYTSLIGSRAYKFDELTKLQNQDFDTLDWEIVEPSDKNLYTLTTSKIDYSGFDKDNVWNLDKIFILSSIGIQSEQDEIVICNNKNDLDVLIKDFQTLSENTLMEKYPIRNTGSWKLNKAIESCKKLKDSHITKIIYRPFDIRYTYLSPKANSFLGRPRYDVMKHMLHENIGLNFTSVHGQNTFQHVLMSKNTVSRDLVNSKTRLAPLYQYDDTNADKDKSILHKTENLTVGFREFIDTYYDTHYTPEQILYYIYAILHHQGYRDKYNEELKKDFAYIPFVKDNDTFLKLSALGENLALAHTDYEIPNEYKHQSEHVGVTADFSIQSREVKVKDNKLFYNKSNYFDNVSDEIFNFKIGGYQVLKTLITGSSKQPKTSMSSDEREHVENVISILRYTIDVMKDIEGIEFE